MSNPNEASTSDGKPVRKFKKQNGRFKFQWKGRPYTGPFTITSNEDPEWEQPILDCSVNIYTMFSGDSDSMKAYRELLSAVGDGHIVIHYEDRQWDVEKDGWWLLVKWSETYFRATTEQERVKMRVEAGVRSFSVPMDPLDPEFNADQLKEKMLRLAVFDEMQKQGNRSIESFKTEDIKGIAKYCEISRLVLTNKATVDREDIQYAGNGRWRFLVKWFEPKEQDYGKFDRDLERELEEEQRNARPEVEECADPLCGGGCGMVRARPARQTASGSEARPGAETVREGADERDQRALSGAGAKVRRGRRGARRVTAPSGRSEGQGDAGA